MLEPKAFLSLLASQGVSFFCGVPDSLLSSFCAALPSALEHPDKHLTTANEGNALAVAAGHYLATGSPALVYLQNSGLGNIVNPLLSLADPDVYGIPALLLVGWRGEPGVKDEPQHIAQGRLTLPLLDALNTPYAVLPDDMSLAEHCVREALRISLEQGRPFALVVHKGTFVPGKIEYADSGMSREDALRTVVQAVESDAAVVSTTGMLSRELFDLRAAGKTGYAQDFLTIGSMGHCSSIALGIALAQPERKVWVLDGDGSLLMHLGSLGVAASAKAANLRHIVFNNAAHDSVGGQPTVACGMDLPAVARACGYKTAAVVRDAAGFSGALAAMKQAEGPSFLEIVVRRGSRKDLGRPTTTPKENRVGFMRFLAEK